MRRVLMTWMLAFTLLAPVACGVTEEPAADAPESAVEGGEAEAESGAEAPDASEEGEAGDEGSAAVDASGEAAEASAEAGAEAGGEEAAEPGPTLSPEEVELIQNFSPPSKGNEDALVTIYEFSDYI